jgi:queuine tRNA-ribosyltransferase/7-cyano-7-deazaguanine tRNA-ribosyltransferase
MEFKILKKSKKSRARLGVIKTQNGNLFTPAFLPVATNASIKAVDSKDLKEIGYQGLISNTFHLWLSLGEETIKKLGGLHKFMNFQGVIFTDSGGFQVFSLGWGMAHGVGKIAPIFPEEREIKVKAKKEKLVKITEEGVIFCSPYTGEKKKLTPEKSIKIQKALKSDIVFAFDECTSPLSSYKYTKMALERTHRWAIRSLKEFKKRGSSQAIFGIVQGGEYRNLREESAKFISSLPFDGFGIGGSLGKSKKDMFSILNWTIPLLDEKKPRHLLGIGYLEDIKEAVKRGIDLFDCAFPTRLARHGEVLTKKGKIDISKRRYLFDKRPIEKNCRCFTCLNYSRAYLCHLFRRKELSVYRLLTIHNLYFMFQFVKDLQNQIKNGSL